MAARATILHDFACPSCWIAWNQSVRLAAEFAINWEWVAAIPSDDGLEEEPQSNARSSPSRYELAMELEGLELPRLTRPKIDTKVPHSTLEFAERSGVQDAWIERLYRAYWTSGLPIDDLPTLGFLATGLIPDIPAMLDAIQRKEAQGYLVNYESKNIHSSVAVPTFVINGELLSEPTTKTLRECLVRSGVSLRPGRGIYAGLRFPTATHADRPYIAINMVSTIDGKTALSEKHGDVQELGSALDHAVMRTIENAADAVMIGANTLRATPKLWYPENLYRYVVTKSGAVPKESRFFTDAPDRAFVVVPSSTEVPAGLQALTSGTDEIDWKDVLQKIRELHGVKSLVVEGGSELNAMLLQEDFVDSLFLTIAPKVKLGRNLPTYAGGIPLSDRTLLDFRLRNVQRVGDELFLHYERNLAGDVEA